MSEVQRYIYRVTPGNFGDDLNASIVRSYIADDDFAGYLYLGEREKNAQINDHSEVIVGIGTILNQQIPTQGRKIVLGAGTGYGKLPIVDDRWNIVFVRGPLTAQKLGLSERFITDPAILIANKSTPTTPSKNIGYMPHHGCANAQWQRVCEANNLLYIDPRNPPEQVFAMLSSCEKLITEAMHGAIVADALRIPWLATSSASKINDFKWQDWTQSMHLHFSATQLPSLWGKPPRSLTKRLLHSIKLKTAEHRLKALKSSAHFSLSSETVFRSKLSQVNEAYEQTLSHNTIETT